MGELVICGGWEELSSYIHKNNLEHFSFDFWNTIAFSNPKFKTERSKLMFKIFEGKVSEQRISEAFSTVGDEYNKSFEAGSGTLTIDKLYERVFHYLGILKFEDIQEVQNQIFKLFLQYPPSIDPSFKTFLKSFDHKKVKLSITSNTTFIPGRVIEQFLKNQNLDKYFSFLLFSDTEMVAKPNIEIFNRLINRFEQIDKSKNPILHIGDNVGADYYGARNAGLQAFHLINKSTQLSNQRYALHAIENIEKLPFSEMDYSKFKYGDHTIAQEYGQALFSYFKKEILPHFNGNRFLIYSSPYAKIPTSSYYLTDTFYRAFLSHLANESITDVQIKFAKIERCQTYTDDYGAMTAEERYNLIKNDTYELVDKPTHEDICIFIDDISITGTHQKVVEQLLEKNGVITTSLYLYFAKLNNTTIHPSFENKLNYAYINHITKLTELIKSEDYRITTRTTKYLLSLTSDEFNFFVSELITSGKAEKLEEILTMSFSNNYNSIEQYKTNLHELQRAIPLCQSPN